MSDSVKVVVRVRPLISREQLVSAESNWIVEDNQIKQKNASGKPYLFDEVFDQLCTTEDVYKAVGVPIVRSVMDGFNGTIFAYGQTASGKTFTMMGDFHNLGIIPRAIREIFEIIESAVNREFLMRVSYMEIYNECVLDLLCPRDKRKNLEVREYVDGQVFVANLEEVRVVGHDQILQLMKTGENNRHFGVTNMNERSSRSHTIFRLVVESRERSTDPRESMDDSVHVAHLNLVDLAGSEKARQTGASGQRLAEGGFINKSLFTLGQVIAQLSDGAGFVNYRDSKLTRILQNALGGNSKTVIITNVTPAAIDETHSTLRFATSAKKIKNKPVLNEILSDEALLKRCKTEIVRLKKLLTGNVQLAENQELQMKLKEKEKLEQEQRSKIESLRNFILVSSQINNAAVDAKKHRRQTWCPGKKMVENTGKRAFFPSTEEDDGCEDSSEDPLFLNSSSVADLQQKRTIRFDLENIQELSDDSSYSSTATKEIQTEVMLMSNADDTVVAFQREIDRLNEAKAEIEQRHMQTCDEYREQEGCLRTEIQQLKESLNLLECKVSAGGSDVGGDTKMAARLAVLEEANAALKQEQKRHLAQITGLQEALTDRDDEAKFFADQVSEIQKELKRERSKDVTGNDLVKCTGLGLCSEMEALKAAHKSMEQEKNKYLAQVEALEESLRERDDDSQALSDRLSQLQIELQQERAKYAAESKTLSERINDFVSEQSRSTEKIIALSEKLLETESLFEAEKYKNSKNVSEKLVQLQGEFDEEQLKHVEECRGLSERLSEAMKQLEDEKVKQNNSNPDEIADLKCRINCLELQNQKLLDDGRDEMEMLTMKICQLEEDNELLQASTQLNDDCSEIQRRKTLCGELQEKLETQNQQQRKLMEEVEKWKAAAADLTNKSTKCEELLAASREMERKAVTEMQALQEKLYELQEQNENLKGEFSEEAMLIEMEQLRAKVQDLEEEKMNMSLINVNDSDTLSIESDILRSTVQKLEAEKEALQGGKRTNVALLRELEECQLKIYELEFQINSYEENDKKAASSTSEIQTLRRKTILLEAENERLLAMRAKLDWSSEISPQERSELMDAISLSEDLVKENTDLRATNKKLQKDLMKSQNEVHKLLTERDEAVTELEDLRDFTRLETDFRNTSLMEKKISPVAMTTPLNTSSVFRSPKVAMASKVLLEEAIEENKTLTGENKSLSQELASLKKTYKNLVHAKNDLDSVMDMDHAKFQRREQELRDQLEQAYKDLHAARDTADSQLSTKKPAEDKLTQTESADGSELEILRSKLTRIQAELDNTLLEKSQLQKDMDEQIDITIDNQSDLMNQQRELASLRKEIQLLRKSQKSNCMNCSDPKMAARYTESQRECHQLTEQLAQLRHEKSEIEQRIALNTSINSDLLEERSKLLSEKDNLCEQLEAKKDDNLKLLEQLQLLKDSLAEKNKLILQLETDRQKDGDAVSEMEKQLLDASSELSEFKNAVNQLEKRLNKSARESVIIPEPMNVELLRVKYDQLLTQSNQTEGKLLSEVNRDLDSQKRIEELEQKRKETIDNFCRINKENQGIIDKLNKDVYELKCQLQKAQGEEELATHKLKKREQELETLKCDLRHLEDIQLKLEAPVIGRQQMDPDKMADKIKKMGVSLDLTNQRCQKSESRVKELEVMARKTEDAMFARDSLQRQLRDTEQLLRENQSELSAVQQRYSSSYADIARLKMHADSLQEKLDQGNAQIVSMEEDRKTSMDEMDQLTKHRDQLLADLRLSDSQRAQAVRELTSLQGHHQNLDLKQQGLLCDLEEVEREKRQLTESLRTLEVDQKRLKSALQHYESAGEKERMHQTEIQKDFDNLKGECARLANENQEKNEQLQTNSQKIDNLQQQNDILQKNLYSAQQNLTEEKEMSKNVEEKLNSQVKQYEEELEKITAEREASNSYNAELSNKISHLEHLLEEREHTVNELRSNLAAEIKEKEFLLEKTTKALDELREEKLNVGEQFQHLDETHTETLQKFKQLERDNYLLEQEKALLLEQLDTLEEYQEKNHTLLVQVAELKGEKEEYVEHKKNCLKEFEREKESLLAKIQVLEVCNTNSIDEIRLRLLDVEEENVALLKEQDRLISRITELENQNEALDQLKVEREDVLQKVDILQREKKALMDELMEKDEQALDMGTILQKLSQESNGLKEEHRVLQNQIKAANSEVEKLRLCLENTEQELEFEKEKVISIKQELQSLQEHSKQLMEQKSQAMKRLSLTEEQCQKLQVELEDVRGKLQVEVASHSDKETLINKITKLESLNKFLMKENDNLQAQMDEPYNELDALQYKYDTLDIELEKFEKQTAKLESEKLTLQKELEELKAKLSEQERTIAELRTASLTPPSIERELQEKLTAADKESFRQMLRINKLETELKRIATPLKEEIETQQKTITYLEDKLDYYRNLARKTANEQANASVLCQCSKKESGVAPAVATGDGSGVISTLQVYTLRAEKDLQAKEIKKQKEIISNREKEIAELRHKVDKFKSYYQKKLLEEDKSVLKDMVNSPQLKFELAENWLLRDKEDKENSEKCPVQ